MGEESFIKKELTKLLYDKFPELYRGRKKPILESNMSFGFECYDGWFDLISTLSQDITNYCKENNLDIPEVSQVKEKYGELCFYVNSCDDTVFEMIDKAEDKSATICEKCGAEGKLRTGDWHITLCDSCYKIRMDKKSQ